MAREKTSQRQKAPTARRLPVPSTLSDFNFSVCCRSGTVSDSKGAFRFSVATIQSAYFKSSTALIEPSFLRMMLWRRRQGKCSVRDPNHPSAVSQWIFLERQALVSTLKPVVVALSVLGTYIFRISAIQPPCARYPWEWFQWQTSFATLNTNSFKVRLYKELIPA